MVRFYIPAVHSGKGHYVFNKYMEKVRYYLFPLLEPAFAIYVYQNHKSLDREGFTISEPACHTDEILPEACTCPLSLNLLTNGFTCGSAIAAGRDSALLRSMCLGVHRKVV